MIDVGDLLFACTDHALSGGVKPSKQLKQHRAGWVERHRHCDLTDVLHAWRAFDLHHLSDVHLSALAADLRTLELEHRGRVVYVSRIQQCTQSTSKSGRQTTNEMRQSNRISTSPWDELELYDPVQLGHGLVCLFPVAVQANDFIVELVHHEDVWGHLAFAVLVLFQLKVGVDVIDLAQSIFVVFPLTAFNLVVGLFRLGLVRGLCST